mgnify:CR=1 FL=1
MKKEISRKFCVAPMMGYTTPYARKLYRILSNNSFLFSEMIATKSLIYSKSRENIIDNDFNNPVVNIDMLNKFYSNKNYLSSHHLFILNI